MVTKTESFTTNDGKIFDDEDDAELHESRCDLERLLVERNVSYVGSLLTLMSKEEPGTFNDGESIWWAMRRWMDAVEIVRSRDAKKIIPEKIDRDFLDEALDVC